jgi:hypothetical protein
MILQMNTHENTDALTSTETLTTFMAPHKFTEPKGSKQMRFEQIVFNLVLVHSHIISQPNKIMCSNTSKQNHESKEKLHSLNIIHLYGGYPIELESNVDHDFT